MDDQQVRINWKDIFDLSDGGRLLEYIVCSKIEVANMYIVFCHLSSKKCFILFKL